MGEAYYAKRKFTSFNDTHLADVFKRPSVEMANPYHLALTIGIPALFCVLLGVQYLASATCSFRESSPHLSRSQLPNNVGRAQHTGGKKKTQLFQTSHTLLVASTIALIVTVACLLELSSLPDNNASRKC